MGNKSILYNVNKYMKQAIHNCHKISSKMLKSSVEIFKWLDFFFFLTGKSESNNPVK